MLDAARPEGRLRLRRRAGRAQPRLSQHRPLSARNGCGTSTPWSAASRSRRSRSRRRRRIPPIGARPSRARPRPPCSSSRRRSPTTWPMRRAGRPISTPTTPRWRRGARSSPTPAPAATPASRRRRRRSLGLVDCNGPNYMQCFKKWWAWTQTDEYKSADARHRRGAGFPRPTITCRPTRASR